MDSLVLASSSPRRRQLLEQLGISLVVVTPKVDESLSAGECATEYVSRLAREKAGEVAQRYARQVVLAADTSVVLNSQIMGKPADAAHAVQMLRQLSGATHRVVSGVAVYGPTKGAKEQFFREVVNTKVRFRELSSEEISWYVATGEPMDKAGAYAIQEKGGVFVEWIEGSYSNIVGLPLACALRLLKRARFRLPWEKGA